jgi:hypothetical protein
MHAVAFTRKLNVVVGIITTNCRTRGQIQCLEQCFPARVLRDVRDLQNIVRGSTRNLGTNNFETPQKNYKYSSKYRWNFCPAVGNTGIISVRHQLPRRFFGQFLDNALSLHRRPVSSER